MCLLGPSGCGKTTLLRVIAGLEPDYAGTVTVEGQSMQGVAVHERGFGLMFQDFALFPHMSVVDNIAFGLKMQDVERDVRRERVDEMLEIVGLEGFAERDVAQLSAAKNSVSPWREAWLLSRVCSCWMNRWGHWMPVCVNN